MNREERIAALKSEVEKRILVMDGAFGTMIQGNPVAAPDLAAGAA